MKRTLFMRNNNHGLSYVEILVAGAVLSIIVLSFAMVTSLTSKTGVTIRHRMVSNQFANAIIDNLHMEAGTEFGKIKDGRNISYEEVLGIRSTNDMKASLAVETDYGAKKVDIEVTWKGKNGEVKEAHYYTVLNPRDMMSATGGIAMGTVMYVKQLDPNTNRIPDYATSPELFAGASGITVRAESNESDPETEEDEYTETQTGENGKFILKNIKVNKDVDIKIYSICSQPINSEFVPGYYFFTKEEGSSPEKITEQKGKITRKVNFEKIGEKIEINTIICARTWNYYTQIRFEDGTIEDFDPTGFQGKNIIKINGEPVRWGVTDTYQYGSDPDDFWDMTLCVRAPNAKFYALRPDCTSYNVVIHNMRTGIPHFTVANAGTLGSSPEIQPEQPTFNFGIAEQTQVISVNPVFTAPFGNQLDGSHIIAPVRSDLTINGFPIGEHTVNFENTMGLVMGDYTGGIAPPEERTIVLKRRGFIVGSVKDHTDTNRDDITVKLRTNQYTGTGSRKTYRVISKNTTQGTNNFGLYNCVNQDDSSLFSNSRYFYAYGRSSDGIRYFGFPETVNGVPYDTGVLDGNTRNIVDFLVYPGANVEGYAGDESGWTVSFERTDGEYSYNRVTATTDSDGWYSFSDTEVKRYMKRGSQRYGEYVEISGGGVDVWYLIRAIDSTNGEPIVGATIRFDGAYVGSTDSSGMCNTSTYIEIEETIYLTGKRRIYLPGVETEPFRRDFDIDESVTVTRVSASHPDYIGKTERPRKTFIQGDHKRVRITFNLDPKNPDPDPEPDPEPEPDPDPDPPPPSTISVSVTVKDFEGKGLRVVYVSGTDGDGNSISSKSSSLSGTSGLDGCIYLTYVECTEGTWSGSITFTGDDSVDLTIDTGGF